MSRLGAAVHLTANECNKDFMAWIEPHMDALKAYCRLKAGCAWEAEDLLQETLVKAYSMYKRKSLGNMPKAYLLRIAANAWTDLCRKKRLDIDAGADAEMVAGMDEINTVYIHDAMERLIKLLTPQQRSILLLIDVFGCSSKEVALMLRATEGRVKAALHRARKKLQEISELGEEGGDIDLRSVQAYVQAFQARDLETIASLAHTILMSELKLLREQAIRNTKSSIAGMAVTSQGEAFYLIHLQNDEIDSHGIFLPARFVQNVAA